MKINDLKKCLTPGTSVLSVGKTATGKFLKGLADYTVLLNDSASQVCNYNTTKPRT